MLRSGQQNTVIEELRSSTVAAPAHAPGNLCTHFGEEGLDEQGNCLVCVRTDRGFHWVQLKTNSALWNRGVCEKKRRNDDRYYSAGDGGGYSQVAAHPPHQLIECGRGVRRLEAPRPFRVNPMILFAALVALSALQAQDSYKLIAEGKVNLPTAPVAPGSSKENGACSTVSVKAPGVRKGTPQKNYNDSDSIAFAPEQDISKIRGYASLFIVVEAGNDKVEFAVCNPTKYLIVPGRLTLLWRASRLE